MNRLRLALIGTRGFPFIPGGVEKHCELLYLSVAERDFHVTVFRRSPYVNNRNRHIHFRNIFFRDIWAPRSRYLEAVVHSLLASIWCIFSRPDIVHLHNIGPSLVLPLLRLGGIRCIVTYHSPNYEHPKWGPIARFLLRLGEAFVFHFAEQVIFVSSVQASKAKCKTKVIIPNGVPIRTRVTSTDVIERIGAEPGKFILAVARFVPEKGLHDLIAAFKRVHGDWRLLIAGDADHETDYSKGIKRSAAEDKRIILSGYLTGEPLNQIYSHAKLFVLPSYSEGFSIALLEALSYGLPVLASDIPANKEIDLPAERYFRCGDVVDLSEKIAALIRKGISDEELIQTRRLLVEKYDWNKIAEQTIAVYEKVVGTNFHH